MQTLAEIINFIQFKTNETIEEIANKIGYSRGYLTNLKNANSDNKDIINLLYKEYEKILQNVPHETNNIVSEEQQPFLKSEKNIHDERKKVHKSEKNIHHLADDLSMQAIADLTYSGRVQADSVKIQAENNSRLIALLEEKERKGHITAHDVEGNQQGVLTKFEGLLVWLSHIAAGKKYSSDEEAFAEISRLFYGNHKHKLKKDIHGG